MTQATTMRIGVLGLHHDHVWGNLDELNALRPGSIVAAVDPHSSLREKVQSLYGCKVYEDYEELLNREQLTAVYIFAGNRSGAELAVTALNRGLHVLIEKPMAADLSGAVAMNEAATANGRLLMVNWPFAWWPQLQTALHLAKQGDIGRLWQ
ncbi:MAG TPA: Gfo/Idh/MocA family oxidoreductase, partial [Verrucomicrobia bacterium]|nr:Gfo/Idh/MocA family oxidoreductase [Verrucomicrobiota bacterium]